MKKAFTMIELIFIIVIIAILGAVSLPKLTMTTKDAESVKIATFLANCINDASGAYLTTNKFSGTMAGPIDSLPLGSSACVVDSLSTSHGDNCYAITVSDNNGSVYVTESGISKVCDLSHIISRKNGVSENGTTKELSF